MNRSTNFNFYLPTNADPMLVSDLSYNFEQIDSAMLSSRSQSLTATQKAQIKSNLGFTDQNDLNPLKLRRKIKTYTNISLPSGNNPYVKIDDFSGLGFDSSYYLVSMNIRGWGSATCGNMNIVKSSSGTDIYVMASQSGSIGSLTVEYFLTTTVTEL